MVKCKVCGKEFKLITNSHLARHQLTPQGYSEKYPGAILYDDVMRLKISESRYHVERPVCARPGCENTTTQTSNKYCSYRCSMSHRMAKDGRNEQGGMKNPIASNNNWYSIGKRRKKQARERDNYLCQRCNKKVKGNGAHVHHKIPERSFDLPEEAHALSNLVTLCGACHKTVERRFITELYKRLLKFEGMLGTAPDYVKMGDYVESLISQDKG